MLVALALLLRGLISLKVHDTMWVDTSILPCQKWYKTILSDRLLQSLRQVVTHTERIVL